jgi:hypothetical protein
MYAKGSTRHAVLGAIVLVLTGGTAFSEGTAVTVLRGAPPHAQQEQTAQQIVMAPPPLPSCPDGYFYSLLAGYCYRFRDPTAAR